MFLKISYSSSMKKYFSKYHSFQVIPFSFIPLKISFLIFLLVITVVYYIWGHGLLTTGRANSLGFFFYIFIAVITFLFLNMVFNLILPIVAKRTKLKRLWVFIVFFWTFFFLFLLLDLIQLYNFSVKNFWFIDFFPEEFYFKNKDVLYGYGYNYYYLILLLFVLSYLLITVFSWWYTIIDESDHLFSYSDKVSKNLRMGFYLFLCSEIMFFFPFFWAFFAFSLSPDFELGVVWPPQYINVIQWYGLPLLNTIILLTSSISVTWSHGAILSKNLNEYYISIFITILLGCLFLDTQLFEYKNAMFSIENTSFGTVFYSLTGLHGCHVLLGTVGLIFAFYRGHSIYKKKPFNNHYISYYINDFNGFLFTSYYWHFVDIVWLFLYFVVYIWGSIVSV